MHNLVPCKHVDKPLDAPLARLFGLGVLNPIEDGVAVCTRAFAEQSRYRSLSLPTTIIVRARNRQVFLATWCESRRGRWTSLVVRQRHDFGLEV